MFDEIVDTSLGSFHAYHYSPASDGQRFLVSVSALSPASITVVLNHYAGEIERTSALISAASLDAGVSISRVIVSDARWSLGENHFLAGVREDAVAV